VIDKVALLSVSVGGNNTPKCRQAKKIGTTFALEQNCVFFFLKRWLLNGLDRVVDWSGKWKTRRTHPSPVNGKCFLALLVSLRYRESVDNMGR
jgi:hypothetical protein